MYTTNSFRASIMSSFLSFLKSFIKFVDRLLPDTQEYVMKCHLFKNSKQKFPVSRSLTNRFLFRIK